MASTNQVFNKLELRGNAQHVEQPGTDAPAKLRGYYTKVHQLFIRRIEG